METNKKKMSMLTMHPYKAIALHIYGNGGGGQSSPTKNNTWTRTGYNTRTSVETTKLKKKRPTKSKEKKIAMHRVEENEKNPRQMIWKQEPRNRVAATERKKEKKKTGGTAARKMQCITLWMQAHFTILRIMSLVGILFFFSLVCWFFSLNFSMRFSLHSSFVHSNSFHLWHFAQKLFVCLFVCFPLLRDDLFFPLSSHW